jgi:chromosome segregation ATPase
MTINNHLNIMKNKTLFLMMITAGLITTGCGKKQTASEKLDEVKEKTAEVTQDVMDYTYTEKEEFVKKERIVLAELNRDLDELTAQVEKSSDAVKAEAQPRIETLREQTARLNKQLDDASNTVESNWEKFKGDVRNARDASKEEFDDARQWLSDKISPR